MAASQRDSQRFFKALFSFNQLPLCLRQEVQGINRLDRVQTPQVSGAMVCWDLSDPRLRFQEVSVTGPRTVREEISNRSSSPASGDRQLRFPNRDCYCFQPHVCPVQVTKAPGLALQVCRPNRILVKSQYHTEKKLQA